MFKKHGTKRALFMNAKGKQASIGESNIHVAALRCLPLSFLRASEPRFIFILKNNDSRLQCRLSAPVYHVATITTTDFGFSHFVYRDGYVQSNTRVFQFFFLLKDKKTHEETCDDDECSRSLTADTSVSTVFQYQTYSTTVGPMVGAAVQHMHALDSVGGYYHRTISGPGAALDALWSDVLPGGIPIVPTAGLVFTVDNSYLYPYDTTSVISTQTIVLWNSVSSLMLFRIKSITYPTGIINYGGYLGPTASYKIALGSRSHNLSRHRCRCRTPSCRV